MNLLGLIFSLLLILSYSFWASWEKQNGSSRLRIAYLGSQRVNRKFLNRFESELYKELRQKPNPAKEPSGEASPKTPKVPEINPPCARFNILPLVTEGRDEHPFLYETLAKLFRTFYKPLFPDQARFEYRFLDKFLASIRTALKKDAPVTLEKLSLGDLHPLYYRMLKGTTPWDLAASTGLPPLLDYIKFEPSEDKICLSHAHPDLLSVLFTLKTAPKIFATLHDEKTSITQTLIEQFFLEAHMIPNPAVFDLLHLSRPTHKSPPCRTYLETDETSHISLRKNLYLNPS